MGICAYDVTNISCTCSLYGSVCLCVCCSHTQMTWQTKNITTVSITKWKWTQDKKKTRVKVQKTVLSKRRKEKQSRKKIHLERCDNLSHLMLLISFLKWFSLAQFLWSKRMHSANERAHDWCFSQIAFQINHLPYIRQFSVINELIKWKSQRSKMAKNAILTACASIYF